MGKKWHKKTQGLEGSESRQSLFPLGGLVCVCVNTVWSLTASERSLAQETETILFREISYVKK